MLELFEKLTMALYGNPGIAIGASFLWGILSILLSPCHLAGIPIMIAFINDQKNISTRKAFFISLNFSLGILFSLTIVGIIAMFAGLILGRFDLILRMIISLLLILVGLYFLDIVHIPDLASGKDRRIKDHPNLSGLIFGLIFGLTLGPCALAFMAPILGIAMQSVSTSLIFGSVLVLAYILGHCGILVIVGTFTEIVKKYLSWNTASKGTLILRRVCGILIITGALITIIKVIL